MKRCISLIGIMCLIGCSVRQHRPFPNQTGDFSEIPKATADAQRHAQEDHGRMIGCCAGGCFGLLGIAGAYIYRGAVPPQRLSELSSESDFYISVYTEEYIQESKRLRTGDAIVGHVITLIASVGMLTALSVAYVATQ